MIRVSMTGASGTMGTQTTACLLEDPDVVLRLLLRRTKRGIRFARKVRRRYGKRVEILFGDIRDYDSCIRLCDASDYLLHLAAVIPPKADHDAADTMSTNHDGTKNLIRAVIQSGNHTKFVHISTVAVYGYRNEKHPWGRVGDPLLTSAFDVYGSCKTMAEYAVLESELRCWAVLRQTAVLYDNILMNNISDGLMFHTPWNVPIEWVTAKDSGILLAKIIQSDRKGEADDFWKKVYNIGGGESARQTGYETFDDGFRLIGGSVKQFFRPKWNPPRNFHCIWFSDSDKLNDRFCFRTQGCGEFWNWYADRHRIYRAGKILPPALLRRLIIEPLLKNKNAPQYWLKHGDTPRIQAFFGGQDAFAGIPDTWEETKLFCESQDYDAVRKDPFYGTLDHGYDERKKDSELSLDDMKQAAAFRGGECLSETMMPGELYGKLLWKCHDGHAFEAAPYTILKAGHWCPECCQTPMQWRMDRVAHFSPFHAQVWRDSHEERERYLYRQENGEAFMEEDL